MGGLPAMTSIFRSAFAAIVFALIATSPVLGDDAAPLGPSRPLRVLVHGTPDAADLRSRLEAELGMPTVPAEGSCDTPCLVVTIESPGSAGARSDAERRGVTIESPGSAGARSDAERRGVTIESPGSAGARSDAERRGVSI